MREYDAQGYVKSSPMIRCAKCGGNVQTVTLCERVDLGGYDVKVECHGETETRFTSSEFVFRYIGGGELSGLAFEEKPKLERLNGQ